MDTPNPTPHDELISPTAFFMRPSDKTRYDFLLRSLLDDKRAAILVSDCDALLDHYGRMLADALRKSRELAVEVYFPNSTEAVLARFNRILADLTVAEAIKPDGSSAPQRLLLVYDGKGTGLKEIQLLARLVKDFPGANTRLVLLLQSQGADADKKIEAFGKIALRWDVERPTSEEAKTVLNDAQAKGMGPEVQALLDATGVHGFEAALALRTGLRALALADEALGDEPSSKKPLAQAASGFGAAMAQAAAAQEGADREPHLEADRATGQQAASTMRLDADDMAGKAEGLTAAATPPKKKMPGVLVLGLVALGASAAITLVQHEPWKAWMPQPTALDAELMAKAPNEKEGGAEATDYKGAAENDDKGVPDANASANAVSSNAVTPSNAGDSDNAAKAQAAPAPTGASAAAEPTDEKGSRRRTDSNARVLGPVPEQLSEPELKQQRQTGATPREPEAIAQDSPVRNPIAAPRVVAQAPAPAPASSNVKDAKDAKDAKSTKGVAEPRGLAPGFYVQHASRSTRAEVERFKAQNPVLSRARVIRLKRQGAPGDNWVLLSGPFASLDQARAFLARKGIPSDSWVRPASALRPLLMN
jgi:hypothetical protein